MRSHRPSPAARIPSTRDPCRTRNALPAGSSGRIERYQRAVPDEENFAPHFGPNPSHIRFPPLTNHITNAIPSFQNPHHPPFAVRFPLKSEPPDKTPGRRFLSHLSYQRSLCPHSCTCDEPRFGENEPVRTSTEKNSGILISRVTPRVTLRVTGEPHCGYVTKNSRFICAGDAAGDGPGDGPGDARP